MSCNKNRNVSYITNLVSAARQNHKKRHTVVKGDNITINVMCIPMCGDVGVEVHRNEDQLVTVACGSATVKLGNTRCTADCVRRLCTGDSVFIPAGTWHNICNTGNGPLKLISVYAFSNDDDDDNDCNKKEWCGCTLSTETAGCTKTTADCGTVFNASNYNWQDNEQTRDDDCGCAINSGC